MRELILLNDLENPIKFEFNPATSEIYIHCDSELVKLPPKETAKLQNWFLSL